MNPSLPVSAALLQSRLLQCMRRVLLIDLELSGEFAPQGVCFSDTETYTPGSFDAIAAHDVSRIETVLDLLAAHGAIYIYHPGAASPPAPPGTIPYITWDDMTMVVHEAYDPVAHARDLLRLRRPREAYEVLVNVPPEMVSGADANAAVASQMQWCLLALSMNADVRTALNLFFRAQEQFFLATTYAPYYQPSYLCHARHWQRIGRDDMARRLLRTYNAVAPAAEIDATIAALPNCPAPIYDATPPEYSVEGPSPRILIVCHEGSDYGLDTLYDGLCDVLGDDSVVELPWKPTLHGKEPERAEGYPCVYHRRGDPVSLASVEAELRSGGFDLILFADTLKTLDPRGVRQIMGAAANVPLVILDTWDEGGDYRDELLAFLGRDTCHAYFKREMLAGVDYGSATYPLAFAYSDGQTPRTLNTHRDNDLFWAGKPAAGLRPIYLDRLAATLGLDPHRRYTQAEYREALARSRIGLNLCGYGFDTVRYWEVPAYGAMLLSERPPICIPHNFVDGTHAVFFDDLPDLEAKLDFYLHHPEETAAIAAAGREHFLRYHTSSARARQFLGVVSSLLNWT